MLYLFWLCPWTITCISNTYGFIDEMNAVILVIKHLQIIQIFMIVCLYKVAQICSISKEGCSFLGKKVNSGPIQNLKTLITVKVVGCKYTVYIKSAVFLIPSTCKT